MPINAKELVPEGRSRYTDDEMRRMLGNYDAIGYMPLLSQASRCRLCASIEEKKRPYNLLASDLGLAGSSTGERCERIARCGKAYSQLVQDIVDGHHDWNGSIEALAGMVVERVLSSGWDGFGGVGAGLACGLNPWTDFCLSKWEDPSRRCGILVVMSDWFSLGTALKVKSVFDYRYHECIGTSTRTWSNFWGHLRSNTRVGRDFTGYLDFSRHLISKHNVMFTNAMACLRKGEKDVGKSNISRRSFENCSGFLWRQIELLRPRIIIPMGEEPHRSVLGLFNGRWVDEHARLMAGFAPGGKPQLKGRNMLSEMYEADDKFSGLEARLPNGDAVHVIPLYHTALPNRWQHDYDLAGRAVDLLLGT